ncbi:hypothetical protein CCACVL1_18429 [Corchorus capsularis]|uniref:Uncharacterized protein n=1 Tax=Corchorus capsularis TaxID=210143 RepID=A0A1R3HL71_COCAP|nr:hypothetical protein CCACVL1_18429 [Corchorus capsularis]
MVKAGSFRLVAGDDAPLQFSPIVGRPHTLVSWLGWVRRMPTYEMGT